MRHRYAPALILTALVLLVAVVLWVAADEAGGATRPQIRATICSVFTGTRCAPALRVALCETGGTLNPRARGSAGERGLFQIHPVHFRWLDENRLYDPLYNTRVAYSLSRRGTNWTPWTCRP